MERVNRNITHFIVHCSATTVDMDVGRWWIRDVHLRKGYADIGYNFFIRRDGTREKGRGLKSHGAHTLGVGKLKGANRYSIGVCYAGGIDKQGKPENNITVDQWLEILELFREAQAVYPGIKIAGHNQFDKKACPSFDVREMARKHGVKDEDIEQRELFVEV